MKKNLSVCAFIFLTVGFYSCEKKAADPDTLLCNNSVKDGKETEIDCGGVCEPCPPSSTFFAVMIDSTYPYYGAINFTGKDSKGQILSPSIRVYTYNNDNRPLNFMFIPGPLNQPLPISAASFDFFGEPYIKADGDTGTVIITAHDTLRQIISGIFSFQGQMVTKSYEKCVIREGSFTNVRYKKL